MKNSNKSKITKLKKSMASEDIQGCTSWSVYNIKQFVSANGKKLLIGITATGLIATMAFSLVSCKPKVKVPEGTDIPPIVNPDTPDQPDTPDIPIDPDVPDVPVDPDIPVDPDQPDNPDVPIDPTPTPEERKIDETLGYDPDFDYSDLSFAELYPSERRVIAENIKGWIHDIVYKNPYTLDLKFLALEIIPETNQFVSLQQIFTKSNPTGDMFVQRYTTNEAFTMDTLLRDFDSLTSKDYDGEPLLSCDPMTNSDNATEDIQIKMDGVANKITGKTDYDYVTYQKNGGGFVDGYLDCGCQDMRISMLDRDKIDLYDILMKADGNTKDPVLEHIINGTENNGKVGVGTYRIARKQSYEFENLFYNFRSGEVLDHGRSLGHIDDANPEVIPQASYKIMIADKVIGVSKNGKINIYPDIENI